MAFLTLKEAADYARFACAAYAVFDYEDAEERDARGDPKPGAKCAQACTCCKSKDKLKSYGTVIRCFFRLQHPSLDFS